MTIYDTLKMTLYWKCRYDIYECKREK